MKSKSISRPNILLIMADQLSALALPCYGNKVSKTPNINIMANNGTVFENNYCNFPVSAPSRASMMCGRLPASIDCYDNGSEFKSSIPTFIHFLRNEGYYTCLSGKMHFVGPDQLHGFEDRLTTEIYPADFSWTANWKVDGRSVKSNEISGIETALDASDVYAWNMQMDYDEEVFFQSKRKLYELSREKREKQFCMCTSFSQPHDPFITTKEYWDLYKDDEIDMPKTSLKDVGSQDEHSKYLYEMYRMEKISGKEDIINARHAYYGMISYIDKKIGQLIKVLKDTGLIENTIVILTSDHGEMLGERGMWYKKTFFEPSLRVPLIMYSPNLITPKKVKLNTSLVDVAPTIIDFCCSNAKDFKDIFDGNSLFNIIHEKSDNWEDILYAEHNDSGTQGPRLMVKKGNFKYIWSENYEPILYDLQSDPKELNNLANVPIYKDVLDTLHALVEKKWNIYSLKTQIINNQKQRLLVSRALGNGRITNWEIGSTEKRSTKYVRYNCKFPEIERDNYVRYFEEKK